MALDRNNGAGPEHRFGDLVDVAAFARVMDSLFRTSGIPNGLAGEDGEILCRAGWVEACERFHRGHPLTGQRCRESNLALMKDLRGGEVAGARCMNGLIDYATPVVIGGRRLATLFAGQVLSKPPDLACFKSQAKEFGYDQDEYLAAIEAVPVVSAERVEALMDCMVGIAQLLAASGLARMRQAALESDLSRDRQARIALEDILEASPVGVGWSDASGRIEYVNHQFTRLFGYALEDIPDLDAWYRKAFPDRQYRKEVIYPWQRVVAQCRKDGTAPPELEASVNCRDGSECRVLIRVSWVGDRRLVSFSDITAHWQSEMRNRAHDAMLEMVARGTPLPDILHAIVHAVEAEDTSARCSVLLLDDEGRCLTTGAAPSLPDFYNDAIDGIEIGMGVGSCGTAAYLGQRVVVENVETHDYWRSYLPLARQAGVAACWSEPIMSSDGKVLGTFAIYHAEPSRPTAEDVERIGFAANLSAIAIENRRTREELERRAYSDYLTGLANRRFFVEQAELELSRVRRYGGTLSLVMFDLDHFKRINDLYGHAVGDLVLRKVADVARGILRGNDIIGRIGGEEFALVLPKAPADKAVRAAERLRAAIADAPIATAGGLSLRFTASFGVVTADDGTVGIDELMTRADAELYRAKRGGRDRVCAERAPEVSTAPASSRPGAGAIRP